MTGTAWLLAAGLASAGSSTLTLESVLASMQAAEGRLHDVTLSFRQVTSLKATGDTQETRGELVLMRSPERFRVKFTAPVEQIAVYDGTRLTLYLPDAGQAWRQTATSAELARMLGINPASPVGSFRRGYATALRGCDESACRLDFTREGAPPLTWHVRVGRKDWTLEEAWFENTEMKVSLHCANYRINRKLTSRSFRLALPRDTEVQEGLPNLFGGRAP